MKASYLLPVLILAGCSHRGGIAKEPKAIDPEKAAIRKEVPKVDGKHFQLAGQAMNDFSINLLREVAKENRGENVTLCPLGLTQSLAMLHECSGGKTKDALEKALGVKGLDSNTLAAFHSALLNELETDPYSTVQTANGIWVKPRYPIDPAVAKRLNAIFGCSTEVWSDDSTQAQKTIDEWADKNTGGSIKHLDIEVGSDHFIALINALTFQGRWVKEFDPSRTVEGDFTTPIGTVKTQMMQSKVIELPFTSLNDAQALEMPFQGNQYSFLGVLPEEKTGVDGLLNLLDAKQLQKCLKSLVPCEVTVNLPKLNLLASYDLKTAFERLGLGPLFEELRLPKLLPTLGANGTLSDARQQIRLVVDEKGAKAEVITMEAGVDAAPMPFVFDRPFLYFIVHKPTGTVVLCGIVNDPTKN